MSKKHVSNRLDKLFEKIKKDENAVPAQQDGKQPRIKVKKESPVAVKKPILGIDGKPADIAVSDKRQVVETKTDSGTNDSPATMALAFRMDDQSWATLRVTDETAPRPWNTEEQMLVKQVADQLSLALENARLFQQTQEALGLTKEQARRLGLLNNLAAEVSTATSKEEIYKIVSKQISNILEADSASITMESPKGDSDEVVALNGIDILPIGTILPHEETMIGKSIRGKSLISLPNGAEQMTDYLDGKQLYQEGIRSTLVCPLYSGQQIIGTLSIGTKKETAYDDNSRGLMTQVAALVSSSLENTDLLQQTQQRTKDLAVLNEMGNALTSLLIVDEILNNVYLYASQLLDTSNFYIALYNKSLKETSFPLFVEKSKKQNRKPRQNGNGFTEVVIRSHKTLLIEDNIQEIAKELNANHANIGAKSWLGVPMMVGNEAMGVIGVQNYERSYAFDSRSQGLLEAIASQSAIAIQNALSFQEARHRSEELLTAADVSQAVSAILSLDELLPQSVELIHQRFDLYYAGIFLLDNKGEYAVLRAGTGEPGKKMLQAGHKLAVNEESMIGWCIQHSKARIALDVGEDAVRFENPNLPDTHSELALPLIARGNVLGAMTIQSAKAAAFDNENIAVLQTMANQIANSIQNAIFFQEIEQRRETVAFINRVVSEITNAESVEQALRTVLEELLIVSPASQGTVFLLDEKEEELVAAISLNEFGEQLLSPTDIGEEGSPIPTLKLSDNPLFKQVVQTKNLLLINEAANSPMAPEAVKEQLKETGIESLAILPIIVNQQVAGVMNLNITNEGGGFNEQQINLAITVLSEATSFIERLRAQEAIAQSEEHMRSLVENAPEAIIIINTETGKFSNPNGNALRLYGLSSEEINKVGPADMSPYHQPDGRKSVEVANEKLKLAMESDTPVVFEWVTRSEPGDLIPCEIRLVKLPGEENQIRATVTDISERKKAEEALQRQNEYLAGSAEVARLVTSTLDMDTLFSRTVNLVCEQFGFYHAAIFIIDDTGYNAVLKEATGEAGEKMKQDRHALAVGSKSTIGTATSSGKPVIVNNTALDPAHQTNPLLPETRAEAAFPLKVGDRLIGALDIQATDVEAFTEDDISVIQTMADQIAIAIENARSYDLAQQAIEEMRELDSIKSQFLANMSHELRTPLNSIIGFSRVILKGIDGPITELQQQDLNAIYNSGQHLLGLINDILDLSKIEAGKMELAFEEINLTDIINSVLSSATGLIKDKPIKLIRKLADGLPPVQADSMRVRQILLNLISNAAKFTEEGAITVETALKINSLGQKEIMVSVTDTGPGISQEDQKKLFQAFSQVDSSPTRKTGGTGLGLAISHQLVQLHGGNIGTHSTVGKGSTFYFTLPIKKENPQTTGSGSNKVILAIDDDPQVIELYERYLQPQGYQVISLTDPTLAREKVAKLKPYAVTLDIMMPGRDGWQVMQELKSDPETRKTPIIICSIVEEEEKGFSLGAADYLVKPVMEEELVNSIHRVNGGGSINEVMIIDDDPDDLRLLGKMLSDNGKYKPVMIEGGVKGWDAIQKNTPQAIILDLFMPDLNGFTILENLRTTPALKDIPIIVLSGAELTKTQQEQLQKLGQRLIEKGSLQQEEILEILERSLKHVNA
ncbi:MAG: GAF domain-containing protein [Anaerolineales bacterium]|nr:GAF domain-containing protein [Anaerolineales bacterium]